MVEKENDVIENCEIKQSCIFTATKIWTMF